MIIEKYALWGDEPTEEHPATFTAYIADPISAAPDARKPAMIVCGGGGFHHIASHEQEPVALAYLDRGYQVFVLDYVTISTGDVSYPNPEIDLAKMIATVRANAAEWRVDPDRVACTGFSAGGFICASVAAGWKSAPFAAAVGARPLQIRPDAIVLGYPLLDPIVYRDEQLSDPRIDLRVPKTGGKTGRDLVMEYMEKVMGCEATDEALAAATPANVLDHRMPPTFVWGTSDDKTCPIVEVYDFAAALARAGVRHEVHVFDTGHHGLSVANANTRVDNADEQAAVRPWFDLACAFLERVGVA